jgi:hypothetical protein
MTASGTAVSTTRRTGTIRTPGDLACHAAGVVPTLLVSLIHVLCNQGTNRGASGHARVAVVDK